MRRRTVAIVLASMALILPGGTSAASPSTTSGEGSGSSGVRADIEVPADGSCVTLTQTTIGTLTTRICGLSKVNDTVANSERTAVPMSAGVATFSFSCYGGVWCYDQSTMTVGYARSRWWATYYNGSPQLMGTWTAICYAPSGCQMTSYWDPPNGYWHGTANQINGIYPNPAWVGAVTCWCGDDTKRCSYQ